MTTSAAILCALVPVYVYELRRGEEIVSTGQITLEADVSVGQTLTVGGSTGVVRSVVPAIGGREPRIVVQLLPG